MESTTFLTVPNTTCTWDSPLNLLSVIEPATLKFRYVVLRSCSFSLMRAEIIQSGSSMSRHRRLDPVPLSKTIYRTGTRQAQLNDKGSLLATFFE